MSSTKEYLMEVQHENCIEWIRQRYGIEIAPDTDDERWEELAQEYSDMLEAEEAEYEWLNRHSHDEFFHEFFYELAKTSGLLNTGAKMYADMLNKLVYAHAVTLMEALISSVVRKLLVSEQALLINLVTEHKQLSSKSVSLKDIVGDPKAVERIVLDALSRLSFHNPVTINVVLTAMFKEHMKDLDVGAIGGICSKRHDIIHRNGKTVDDQPISLTTEEVEDALLAIRAFGENLKTRIHNALNAIDGF